MNREITRRSLLLSGAGALAFPNHGLSEAVIALTWEDLVPTSQADQAKAFSGLVQHGESDFSSVESRPVEMRNDWNGKQVQLPGYVIPIEFDGSIVTEFLLVPYVGACIHVPPPPANQLVLVKSHAKYEMNGLFEPVNVVGTFWARSETTELADVGYMMEASKVEPYD